VLQYYSVLARKTKLVKFATVGIIATLVHASVYLLLVKTFILNDQLSNFVGFSFALTVSYYGQRYWTFSDKKPNSETNAKLKFLTSSILSYCLNAFWVFFTVQVLSYSSEYATIGIVFITPVVIFLMLKYWVFL
jgi:putative flippase GtrA